MRCELTFIFFSTGVFFFKFAAWYFNTEKHVERMMIKMRREKQNKIIQYDQKRHKKKFKKKRKGFNPNPVGDMGVGVGGDAKMDCLNGLRWFEMKGKDAYNLHPLVKGNHLSHY